MKQKLLEAIDLALSGEWVTAHSIVQELEDNPGAAWIHAVLHKIEGDLGNSRYWYARAGKLDHFADQPTSELKAIRQEYLAEP